MPGAGRLGSSPLECEKLYQRGIKPGKGVWKIFETAAGMYSKKTKKLKIR
jgi:hypothetical protein